MTLLQFGAGGFVEIHPAALALQQQEGVECLLATVHFFQFDIGIGEINSFAARVDHHPTPDTFAQHQDVENLFVQTAHNEATALFAQVANVGVLVILPEKIDHFAHALQSVVADLEQHEVAHRLVAHERLIDFEQQRRTDVHQSLEIERCGQLLATKTRRRQIAQLKDEGAQAFIVDLRIEKMTQFQQFVVAHVAIVARDLGQIDEIEARQAKFGADFTKLLADRRVDFLIVFALNVEHLEILQLDALAAAYRNDAVVAGEIQREAAAQSQQQHGFFAGANVVRHRQAQTVGEQFVAKGGIGFGQNAQGFGQGALIGRQYVDGFGTILGIQRAEELHFTRIENAIG